MIWSKRLSTFALIFFGYATVAAVVTIAAGWPAQFGGPGDPAKVASEFVSRGTAAAPPLIPMLLLGAAALGTRNPGRWGFAAAVLLTLLGVVFVIGGFGEILAPDPVTTPRVVLLVGGLLAILGGVTLAGLGVTALVERFRRTDQAEATR